MLSENRHSESATSTGTVQLPTRIRFHRPRQPSTTDVRHGPKAKAQPRLPATESASARLVQGRSRRRRSPCPRRQMARQRRLRLARQRRRKGRNSRLEGTKVETSRSEGRMAERRDDDKPFSLAFSLTFQPSALQPASRVRQVVMRDPPTPWLSTQSPQWAVAMV